MVFVHPHLPGTSVMEHNPSTIPMSTSILATAVETMLTGLMQQLMTRLRQHPSYAPARISFRI